LAAAACFFACAVLAALACFCALFFWFALGDLSPMVSGGCWIWSGAGLLGIALGVSKLTDQAAEVKEPTAKFPVVTACCLRRQEVGPRGEILFRKKSRFSDKSAF
jgi:hypothetical protein